jgi:hypothetical protein
MHTWQHWGAGRCFPAFTPLGAHVRLSSQHNFGPSVDGIFSQASNGICTKMGFWLLPNPGGMLPFLISFKRRDDLVDAVDTLRPMMLSRLLGNIPSLRLGMWDAATYNSKSHYWPEHNGRPVPEDIEDRIIEQEDLGHWVFYGALYGPDSVTAPTWEVVKSKFAHIKDVRFQLREDVPERSYLHDRAAVFAGVPTWRELDWHQWVDNAGELFFAPISPVSGVDAKRQVRMCKDRCIEYGFDYLGSESPLSSFLSPRSVDAAAPRSPPRQRRS